MRRVPTAFALIDAAFLADSKFRRLRKRLPDPRDFNSAVGAWLIVLTSARRNGLPKVDAADEAEDTTYLDDLMAVGLLTDDGIPEGPFKAWAPRRPAYPSDAPSAPKSPSAPNTPDLRFRKHSTQLPSIPNVERPRARVDGDADLVSRQAAAMREIYGPDDAPTIEPLPVRRVR